MSNLTLYPSFFDDTPIELIENISVKSYQIESSYKYNTDCLSNHEIERYSKFHNQADKDIYAVSHIELRSLLATALKIKQQEIVIEFPQNNKPFLVNKINDFSLSHSKDVFAVGVCLKEKMMIGVDIEKYQEIANFDDICKTFMHKYESEYIYSGNKTEKILRFLKCWTRKEAILKMTGNGLINELNSICTVGDKTSINLSCSFLDNPRSIYAEVYTNTSKDTVLSCAISNFRDLL